MKRFAVICSVLASFVGSLAGGIAVAAPSPVPEMGKGSTDLVRLPDVSALLAELGQDLKENVAGAERAKSALKELRELSPEQKISAQYGAETCKCGPNIYRGLGCSRDYLTQTIKAVTEDQIVPDEKSSKGLLRFADQVKPLEVCQAVRAEWERTRDAVEMEIKAAERKGIDLPVAELKTKTVPQACLNAMRKCGPIRYARNLEILESNVRFYVEHQAPMIEKLIALVNDIASTSKLGEKPTEAATRLTKKKLERLHDLQNQLKIMGVPDTVIPAN